MRIDRQTIHHSPLPMYYLWGHPGRNPLLIFQYLRNFGDTKVRDAKSNADIGAIDNILYGRELTPIFDWLDDAIAGDAPVAEEFDSAIYEDSKSIAVEVLFDRGWGIISVVPLR